MAAYQQEADTSQELSFLPGCGLPTSISRPTVTAKERFEVMCAIEGDCTTDSEIVVRYKLWLRENYEKVKYYPVLVEYVRNILEKYVGQVLTAAECTPDYLATVLIHHMETLRRRMEMVDVDMRTIPNAEFRTRITLHKRKICDMVEEYEQRLKEETEEKEAYRFQAVMLEDAVEDLERKLAKYEGDHMYEELQYEDFEARVAGGANEVLTSSMLDGITREQQQNERLRAELAACRAQMLEREQEIQEAQWRLQQKERELAEINIQLDESKKREANLIEIIRVNGMQVVELQEQGPSHSLSRTPPRSTSRYGAVCDGNIAAVVGELVGAGGAVGGDFVESVLAAVGNEAYEEEEGAIGEATSEDAGLPVEAVPGVENVMNKIIVMQSPTRQEPVVINYSVVPQSLTSTESGDRLVVDMRMDMTRVTQGSISDAIASSNQDSASSDMYDGLITPRSQLSESPTPPPHRIARQGIGKTPERMQYRINRRLRVLDETYPDENFELGYRSQIRKPFRFRTQRAQNEITRPLATQRVAHEKFARLSPVSPAAFTPERSQTPFLIYSLDSAQNPYELSPVDAQAQAYDEAAAEVYSQFPAESYVTPPVRRRRVASRPIPPPSPDDWMADLFQGQAPAQTYIAPHSVGRNTSRHVGQEGNLLQIEAAADQYQLQAAASAAAPIWGSTSI